MLVAAACLMAALLAAVFRAGAKDPPLDPEVIRRIRRDADQIPKE